jgi:methionyl-tRNA synthetase
MVVSFKDWQKLDFRVGKILEVKNHPNAEKLYLLEVDLGTERKTLVAGLKQHYKPEELKNKKCIIFTNLEPATIRGIKSEGMILAAVNENKKKVIILSPEKDMEVGSKVE